MQAASQAQAVLEELAFFSMKEFPARLSRRRFEKQGDAVSACIPATVRLLLDKSRVWIDGAYSSCSSDCKPGSPMLQLDMCSSWTVSDFRRMRIICWKLLQSVKLFPFSRIVSCRVVAEPWSIKASASEAQVLAFSRHAEKSKSVANGNSGRDKPPVQKSNWGPIASFRDRLIDFRDGEIILSPKTRKI